MLNLTHYLITFLDTIEMIVKEFFKKSKSIRSMILGEKTIYILTDTWQMEDGFTTKRIMKEGWHESASEYKEKISLLNHAQNSVHNVSSVRQEYWNLISKQYQNRKV